MSTPTGKPGKPIDPFAHASQDTYERANPEHHPVESDGEPIRSPYAPSRARERASAERHPEEIDHESILSRYAPKKTRPQPALGPDAATWEDGAPLVPPRAPERLREHSERHAVDANESDISLHPHSQQHEQTGATRRDAGIPDLKRLEATLRWIQREEAATRLPRASQLPPVLGPAPADVKGRRHGSEMLDFRAPRSLEPERMLPPPTMRSRRRWLGAALITLFASIVAAPIGYYFSTGDWSPSSPPAPGAQMASLGPKTNARPSSIGQQELPQTMAQDDDRARFAQSEVSAQRPETLQPRESAEGETVAMLQPSVTGNRALPSSKAIRVLDPEEIKLLMKQGEQLIAAGDVVTARTVLQRAAEAGDANAAIALGATYDPNVLARLGVVGVSADVEQARSWYEKAETLGSLDARRRLDLLANR